LIVLLLGRVKDSIIIWWGGGSNVSLLIGK